MKLKELSELREIYERALNEISLPANLPNLYEPVSYLLGIGGKRIRPLLALASYNMFGEDLNVPMAAAHAVEYFHNFSLMHDDIMDEADLRRGHPTVHAKYNINTAILSGDVMLIYAYKFFENYGPELNSKLTRIFNETSIQICEGQQMDIDFETEDDVKIDDYIQMITFKTAVLLGASLQFGALIGGGSEHDAGHLYKFGKNLGIAFQIQDDILDIWGGSSGKKEAGDIVQRKKTYLYLKSLELLGEEDSLRLRSIFTENIQFETEEALIKEVKGLFENCHVKVYAQQLKENYQQLALSHLDTVGVDDDKKYVLRNLAEQLLNRAN